MNTLTIFKSYHHMSTEKITKPMAETMNTNLLKVDDAQVEDLADYDQIGFGSGISV